MTPQILLPMLGRGARPGIGRAMVAMLRSFALRSPGDSARPYWAAGVVRRYFRLSRYATRSAISWSLRPRLGMIASGLTDCGSRSHLAMFSGVRSRLAPAKVPRLAKWVRFGPTLPWLTVLIAWQP